MDLQQVPPDFEWSFGELDTAQTIYRVEILSVATVAKDGRDPVKHLWHNKNGQKKGAN